MSHFLVLIFSIDYFSHRIGKIADQKELKQIFILDHDSRLCLKLVVEVSIIIHMVVMINMKIQEREDNEDSHKDLKLLLRSESMWKDRILCKKW